MKAKKSLFGWFAHRYHLIIRNEENLEERSALRFNYAKIFFLGSLVFIFMTMCSLTLSTTILAKWLNPTYLEQRNKKEILQLSNEVAILEKQVIQQKNFIALLQSIISGKEPPQTKHATDDHR